VEGLVAACWGRQCDVPTEATKVMATVVNTVDDGRGLRSGSDFTENRREEVEE